MFDSGAVIEGARILLDINVILAILFGVTLGVIFGALPGFSAAMGIAVVFPLTYTLNAQMAIVILVSIYAGAMFGGSIPAILLKTPGTAGAVATVFDGYPMAQKGLAKQALVTSAVASAIGGVFSALLLLFLGPALSSYALKFGPPEMFLIACLGLVAIASVGSGNTYKSLLSGALGLLLGTIGLDYMTGNPRFTWDLFYLYDGIPMIAALIGMLAYSEVIVLSKKKQVLVDDSNLKKKKVPWETLKYIKETVKYRIDLFRGSLIGAIFGMIPGEGAAVANLISYDIGKRVSRERENFGKGAVPGVIAAESSNSSVTGGALLPTLALGIPGSSSTALLIGALLIHGIQPGPGIFEKSGPILYAIILALIVANFVIIFIGSLGSSVFSKIVTIPVKILVPIISMFAIIGAFSINNNTFDVGIMIIFAIVGVLMQMGGYSPIAAIIGLILGPLMESNFILSIVTSDTGVGIFFQRPISIALILIILVLLFGKWVINKFKRNIETN